MQQDGSERKKHVSGRRRLGLTECEQFCHKRGLVLKNLSGTRGPCDNLAGSGKPGVDSPVSHVGIDAQFAKASWRIVEKPL